MALYFVTGFACAFLYIFLIRKVYVMMVYLFGSKGTLHVYVDCIEEFLNVDIM